MSPEMVFCEVLKVKLGLCWRCQDGRGTKAVGCLPKRAADRCRRVLWSIELEEVGDWKNHLRQNL